MWIAAAAVVFGLVLLVWSADKFVDGAVGTAHHAGMSPLLVGMVIVGFGTSAPEMVVSAFAAWDGNPSLALGNGYGSNIANIGLILGITALISPIAVHSQIVRKELPILVAITLFAGFQLYDGNISRWDATLLLLVFAGIMGWTIYQGKQAKPDTLAQESAQEMQSHVMSLKVSLTWLIVGLALLVISSRVLVWGAVEIATGLGVSSLIIGLTIVAIGTSLPELASAIAATRKNEHDLALGNVLGSNLFNTLAVVGIAGSIKPISVEAIVFNRDWVVMLLMTLAVFAMSYGFGRQGRINRVEGSLLLGTYCCYTGYLVYGIVSTQGA